MTTREFPLTLHQLSIFAEVASEASFTKAAEALHLSEPAVSQQIALLERGLGTRLFERSRGRPVSLTDTGRRLLSTCAPLFDQLMATLQDIEALNREHGGCIAFGATRNFCTYLFPWIYSSFRELHTGLTLQVAMEATRQELIDSLLQRRLDLAVVVDPVDDPRLRSRLLVEYDLVVVAQPGHPLAAPSVLPFSALQTERLIVSRYFGATKPIIDKAEQLGLQLQVEWDARTLEAQVHAVIGGMGVALVPYYAVASQLEMGLLSLLRLEGFPVREGWFLVSRVDRTSVPADRFVRYLMEYQARLAQHCQYPVPMAGAGPVAG